MLTVCLQFTYQIVNIFCYNELTEKESEIFQMAEVVKKKPKHEFVDVETSCKECTSYKFCECIGYPLAVLQGEECFEYEYDYDKEN